MESIFHFVVVGHVLYKVRPDTGEAWCNIDEQWERIRETPTCIQEASNGSM